MAAAIATSRGIDDELRRWAHVTTPVAEVNDHSGPRACANAIGVELRQIRRAPAARRGRQDSPATRTPPAAPSRPARAVSDESGRCGDAHRDVEAFVHQVDDAVEQHQSAPSPAGGAAGNRARSARRACARTCTGAVTAICPRGSACEPAADASASSISPRIRLQSARIARARLGQAHAARRAVQEPRADPLLQRGDGARHRRRRQAEAPRRRGKPCASATATNTRMASRRSMGDYSIISE